MYMKKINKVISATLLVTSVMWLWLYWASANDTMWDMKTISSISVQNPQWGTKGMMNMKMENKWGDILTSFINFEVLTDTQKETVKNILDTHRKSMEELRKNYSGSWVTDIQKEEIKTKITNLHNDLISKLTEFVSTDKLDAFKKAVENMWSNIDMFLNNNHMNEKIWEKFEKMNNMTASWMTKNMDRRQEMQNKWKVISEANKYLTGKTYNSLKTKLVAMEVSQLKNIQSKIDVLIEKLSSDTKTNEKKIWIFKELRILIDNVLLEKEDNSDTILNEVLQ